MVRLEAYELSKTILYANELPHWGSSDCPFGHLEQKYSFILTKLNVLNETIQEILDLDFSIREKRKKNEYYGRELEWRPIILKMRLCSELKICTDDLIALNYLLHFRSVSGIWPEEIKIESISALISNDDFPSGFQDLLETKETLKKLNGMGNAIKHSFVNSETLWYKSYEPKSIIVGFYQHYNKKKNKIKPFEVELNSFINDYNIFLGLIKNRLKNDYIKEINN